MSSSATPIAIRSTARSPLDERQRRLVEEHLGLVKRVARPYRRRCRSSLQFDDLLQVGAVALAETAQRFDPERSSSFEALAARRVRGAIQDHFRDLDPLTRGERSDLRRMESARGEAAARLGRPPEREELAGRLGWTGERVDATESVEQSLAQGWAQTRECPPEDALGAVLRGDGRESQPERDAQDAELRKLLAESLVALPERHRLVLDLYYREELTLAEVGRVLGVTESRVCQLHRAAVDGLRRRLEQAMLPVAC